MGEDDGLQRKGLRLEAILDRLEVFRLSAIARIDQYATEQ